MDFNALLTTLTSDLGLGAAGAIVLFGLAVAIDNVLGVANAIKTKTFDKAQLGSFLESQFGTKRAAIVAGAVAAAVVTAVASSLLAGNDAQVIAQGAETVAFATALAGAVAQFAPVAGDVKDKLFALLGL